MTTGGRRGKSWTAHGTYLPPVSARSLDLGRARNASAAGAWRIATRPRNTQRANPADPENKRRIGVMYNKNTQHGSLLATATPPDTAVASRFFKRRFPGSRCTPAGAHTPQCGMPHRVLLPAPTSCVSEGSTVPSAPGAHRLPQGPVAGGPEPHPQRRAPIPKQDLANAQSIQFYDAAAFKQSKAQGQEVWCPMSRAQPGGRAVRAHARASATNAVSDLHQMRILPSALQSKLCERRSPRPLDLDMRPRTPANPPTQPFGSTAGPGSRRCALHGACGAAPIAGPAPGRAR